jgi:outer membrane protein assembly factor BamD
MRFIPLSLLAALWLNGCSSISMPSIPWPGSAPKPDPTAEALYEEGTRYLAEKRYARGIDVLTKLKTDHPFSPQINDVELKIADAYYLNQQYPEAINAFKEFQSMHPTNENIPFIVYRLGQAHLDQFTAVDRDQKNTEIAKNYFENVIQNYPKSPYATDAREKLAKAVGYLAEHDFNVASFYLQQEKYPAARERFEEIVRKYPGTPVAARSLFFLGESYRREKNNVKASLAYEALLQHYPESKFVPEATTYLAQLEKEKQDPLAMLLMRDRRPAAPAVVEGAQQTASSAKLKDVIAKTEIVYEEPGDEKNIIRRVVDKINPFGSAEDGKKKTDSATSVAAKKKATEKEQSPGVVASLWDGINPFGGQDAKDSKAKQTGKNDQLVNQIDDSLKQKGIDSQTQTASLEPPPSELPKGDEAAAPPQTMDTGKLLGDIDANLQKSGKSVADEPAPPEAAPVFRDPAVAEAVAARTKEAVAAGTKASPEPQQSVMSSGLLSSIDQKLKSQGLEPSKFEAPPAPNEAMETPKQEQPKKIELEPKVAVEKGPLFLPSTEVQVQEKPAAIEESTGAGKKPEPAETRQASAGSQEFPRALVQGPAQLQPAAKAAEQNKPLPGQEEDLKGVFEQLKGDLDNISKTLNPFRW